jgi:hypothetical protein
MQVKDSTSIVLSFLPLMAISMSVQRRYWIRKEGKGVTDELMGVGANEKSMATRSLSKKNRCRLMSALRR